jgi:aryl-alcohol dehydrogenase-like predicted oxidoreductase
MEQRFVGQSDLKVSVLGLGTMTFGGVGDKFGKIGNTTETDATRLVAAAIDHGVTLFDTSDNYSAGQSEVMLGKALGAKRNGVVLATKVFGRTGPGNDDIGLSSRHIIAACEASLARLGTDRIDLYQVHNYDSLVPLEETLRALDDLVQAGKVRYIGCSNHFAWQLTKALGVSGRLKLTRYVSQQILYSLIYRQSEHDLLPAAIDAGVGSLIYSPLAQGYLSGKFSRPDAAGRLLATGQLAGVDTRRAAAIVGTLSAIAGSYRDGTVGEAQLALRWLIDRPGVTSVIVGARNEDQLLDNLRAAETKLSEADRDRLDEASAMAPWYPATAQRVFHPERNPRVARKRGKAAPPE